MSDSIRLPRGRRDDHIIMPSKYDSLEFKAIYSTWKNQHHYSLTVTYNHFNLG